MPNSTITQTKTFTNGPVLIVISTLSKVSQENISQMDLNLQKL